MAKDELVAQQQELHEMMIRFANLLLFVFHEVILWNTRQVFNEMSKGIDPSPNPQTGGEQDHGGRGKSEVGRGDQLQTVRGEIMRYSRRGFVHCRGFLLQVEDILTEVQRKEEENRQLQEEMDAARQRFARILPF